MITLEKADEYFERMKEDIVSEIEDGLNKYDYREERVSWTLHDVEIIESYLNVDNNTPEACYEGILREESIVYTWDGPDFREDEQLVHFEVSLEEDDAGNIKYVLPKNNEGVVKPHVLIKYVYPDSQDIYF